MHELVLMMLVLATTQEPARTAPPAPVAQPPRVLTVTYSNGRSNLHVLTAKGRSWTPNFPHQSNAPARDGLRLNALGIDHVLDRDAVVVSVSLLYGSPHQRTVPVSTVRLTGTDPVSVAELSSYGVDPITLSVDAASPALLVQPSVASVSTLLDVSVDLPAHDQPIYDVTFRNRSPRRIMAVAFRMYRGEKQVGSGRRKTGRETPLLDGVGEYSFTIRAASSTEPGFDRLAVTGVLWEDGTVEGESSLKVSEQAIAAGHAQQLRRVLAILDDGASGEASPASPKSLAQIRAAVQALPTKLEPGLAPGLSSQSATIGLQQVKEAVLEDLAEYAREQSGRGPMSAWVEAARARYTAWLQRTGS